MPSPFPGMDPYLEGEMWQEFHDRLANQISAQLLPHLAPKYVALLAKRYVLDRTALGIMGLPPERVLYPDVHIVAPRPAGVGEAVAVPYRTAPGTPVPTVELASPMVEEIPLLSIEIRDIAQRRLVTVIEILSPVNKRGNGARDYDERRIELLKTRTHLLEIDLLRQGTRIELLGELPPAPYYIFLSRWQRRPLTQVWSVALAQPLPAVPVPLLPPDPDVPLDLQAAVHACFELVGYERLLDYTVPPPPPSLSAEETAWLAKCLRTSLMK